MLRLRFLLSVLGARETWLRRWLTVLLRHGGGKGGHFFSAEASQVWQQMSQVILQYAYAGVDFWDDPNMVLPPGEVFDQRGMLIDDANMYVFVFFEISIHMFMI
jgi:hypothetical protein